MYWPYHLFRPYFAFSLNFPTYQHFAVKAHRVPGPLPPPERLLPRGTAAAQLRDRGGPWDQATVLAVYDHWLARRKQVGGPLLSTLWFQQPWKVGSSCVCQYVCVYLWMGRWRVGVRKCGAHCADIFAICVCVCVYVCWSELIYEILETV